MVPVRRRQNLLQRVRDLERRLVKTAMKPDLYTLISGIRTKLAQCLGDGAKRNRVNGILALDGDCCGKVKTTFKLPTGASISLADPS